MRRRREDGDLMADRLPGRQQGLGHHLQWPIGDQRPHPIGEGLAAAFAGNQAKRLEHAPDLVSEIDAHPDQLGARGEQRPDQLAVEALDGHLPVPARPHDLRQATSVVAVGFVQLQRQGGFGVPRIQAHHGQAGLLQRMPVPQRQRTAWLRYRMMAPLCW